MRRTSAENRNDTAAGGIATLQENKMSAPLVHAKPAGKIVFQKEDSWKEKCFSRIDSHDLNFAVILFIIHNNVKILL